jgi:quinol monooxygenase YgiN
MPPKALFVEIEADSGKDGEVTRFLQGAVGPVQDEPDTRDWYALRFAPGTFAIFDTFSGNAERLKHLCGEVGRSLIGTSFTDDVDTLPDIHMADVLACKSPANAEAPHVALHVPLEAKAGQEEAVVAFLQGARWLVDQEPGTLAWYALRLGHSSFAIVDVFPDDTARQAHLNGPVAAGLMERASTLFETLPEIHKGDVLGAKMAA